MKNVNGSSQRSRRLVGPARRIGVSCSKANYFGGTVFALHGLAQIGKVIFTNSLLVLICFSESMGGGVDRALISIVIWLPLVGGFIGSFKNALTAIDLWLTLYLAMVLCWIDPSARYETPLIPLLLVLVFGGMKSGLSMFRLSRLRRSLLQRVLPEQP
jgi:hypothetical protein